MATYQDVIKKGKVGWPGYDYPHQSILDAVRGKLTDVGEIVRETDDGIEFRVWAHDLWDLREVVSEVELEVQSWGVEFIADKAGITDWTIYSASVVGPGL